MSPFSRKAIPHASLVVVRTVQGCSHRVVAPGKPAAVRASLRKAATTKGAVLEMTSMDSPKLIRIEGKDIADFTVAAYDGPRP